MTYEYVDVGAQPDDGTGDPLRTAYIKINNNFAQLQQFGTTKISNGTSNINIPAAGGAIYAMVGDVPNVMTIAFNGVTSSNLTAVGNVVAQTNFVGNGYYLTDITSASSLINGTSNVSIPVTNGNVNTVANGNLTLEVADRLVTVFGNLSVTGNATIAGNITRNSISYGSSELGFFVSDGNANVTIAGTSNVAVFTTTGLSVNGNISSTGNTIGNNVIGNQGVYGNIFTTLIDSGDSSQITVTPDTRFSATVTVDTELDADFIISQVINTSIISASGNVLGPIPSVSKTFYVSKNGSDSNDGGLNTPFLTIAQACTAATALGGGVSIRIASGSYVEQTPILVPPNTAIMGDNLRTVSVIPVDPNTDLFHMTNGTYVWGITVRNYLGAAFAYPPVPLSGVKQNVFVSPYIQNITSSTIGGGTGCRIDGDLVSDSSTKAMILGFYTIINRDGIGVDLLNSAYSQAVNIYTIACDIGLRTRSGSFVTLNGSDCSIGNYGLVSEGLGPLQTSGNTVGYSTGGTFVINDFTINPVSGDPIGPNVNTVMVINDVNYVTTSSTTLTIAIQAASLTIGSGKSYSMGQNVIIANTSVNFMTGTVQTYNSGTGLLTVNVTGTNGSGTYSDWDVNLFPITYYTIDTIIRDFPAPPTWSSSTTYAVGDQVLYNAVSYVAIQAGTNQNPATQTSYWDVLQPNAGNTTVVVQETFAANLDPNTNVEFYTRSAIIASAHTFEYVGAGTVPATALPQYGGIPIPEQEVKTVNGGVVTFTSTDQKGNFRVGKGFTVNQATGTVSGDDFYRSLFAIMTPYILALQEVP
jgi:hypothetical protein